MHYYNEFHAPSAAWLKQLIADKLISNGHVDFRNILEVQPSDLSGFVQCHFFAGIGSCPCQPYSSAGKQLGDADERNLWPTFFRLIRACKPSTIFGEQVASKPVGDPCCPEYANATAEARVMRLHGYGNAIHPGLAAEFIQAFIEVTQ